MTLFGHSLNFLLKRCRCCSTSTQVRVGINILYGIKQLHEVGFVHRDIKPANLAVGRRGKEVHVIHILDFGLAREFILNNSAGNVEIRPPRSRALFRGTVHYCSTNTHARKEQGRADDLWSMLYVLAEMKGPLPWDRIRGDEQIGRVKSETSDAELFQGSPKELIDIAAHVRTLGYLSRPDYHFIYRKLADVMYKGRYKKNLASKEDTKNGILADLTPQSDRSTDSEEDLFQEADFEKNELGF
uniref:Serine/threonine-protein kinase n=1 Tax=Ascaris suum TaxID=6253 RepID=F1LE06_ASCSU